jgi:hypothetical protein
VVPEEVLVDGRGQRGGVTERGDAPDGVAGRGAHGVGVGPAHRLAPERGREAGLVEPVGPGDQGHDRRAVEQEHERLHDLGHLAADGAGRVLRGAGAVGELHGLHPHAQGSGGLGDLGDVRVHPASIARGWDHA